MNPIKTHELINSIFGPIKSFPPSIESEEKLKLWVPLKKRILKKLFLCEKTEKKFLVPSCFKDIHLDHRNSSFENIEVRTHFRASRK